MERYKFQRCEDPVRESKCHGKRESQSSSGEEEEAACPQAVLDLCGIRGAKPPD